MPKLYLRLADSYRFTEMNNSKSRKDLSDTGSEMISRRKKFLVTGLKTIHRLQDPYYQGKAAELGFYFIFAIVPIMTLLFQMLNQLTVARSLYDHFLESFGDNVVVKNIVDALQGANSGGISLVFLIVTVWTASKLEFSLIRMSNYTYQYSNENGFIGYFKARFRAIITLIILIVILMISLVVLVYGNMLIDMLGEVLGVSDLVVSPFLTSMLRWPLALFLYWLFLAFNYMMTPNQTLKLKEVLPGSLFAAIGILVATIAYYIYFKHFSHLNLVYGSLAAIIALLLWFYWLGYILMVGIVVNASWFERGEEMDD